jgi:AAA domain
MSKVLVMTGGPGVGKTTIVKGIPRILSAKGVNLLLCAPTGRAAKRMTEATRLRGQDHPPAAGGRNDRVAAPCEFSWCMILVARPERRRIIIVGLSQHVLETLREDDEFVLYWGEHSNQPGSPSVLLVAPSTQPALATLKKIEHEYSLRDELDSAWAVRSLACPRNVGRRRSCSKTVASKLSINSLEHRWR